MHSDQLLSQPARRTSTVIPSTRGFTLIETMVALVIIAISLLALAGLLINSIKLNQASEQRMDAAAVSLSILGDCKALIMSASNCNTITSPRNGYTFTLTVTTVGASKVVSVSLRPQKGDRMTANYVNTTVVAP